MIRNYINSRKGNIVVEGALFIIIIFVFLLISVFGYKLLNDVSPDIKSEVTLNESVQAYEEIEDRYPSVFSGLFVLLFLGFWGFVIVAAFMSTEHPMMFMFSIILMIFVIIVSMLLGNFYEEFFTDTEYTGVTDDFTIPNFIFSNLLRINLGILFSGILVAFAKSKYEQ